MKIIFHYAFFLYNYILLKLNRVKFSDYKIFGRILIQNKGSFVIGSNIRINSGKLFNVIGGSTRCTFVIKRGAIIEIGNNVSISNSAFYSAVGIRIDDNVLIGGDCRIWDADFHPLDPEARKATPNLHYKKAPIHIQESAFIGGGCIILKGVTIGRNAIVGAGSVVSRNIPDNEIWAGNPAKFIKLINPNEKR